MKSFVLLLACAFLPMQTFYYMDCCCGDFCTHKNACSGCQEDQAKPCDVHPNHQLDGDCCKDKAKPARPHHHESHRKACTHVSPSSEITVHSADVTPPQAPPLDLVENDRIVRFLKDMSGPTFLLEIVPRSTGAVPLHLLLSVLQV